MNDCGIYLIECRAALSTSQLWLADFGKLEPRWEPDHVFPNEIIADAHQVAQWPFERLRPQMEAGLTVAFRKHESPRVGLEAPKSTTRTRAEVSPLENLLYRRVAIEIIEEMALFLPLPEVWLNGVLCPIQSPGGAMRRQGNRGLLHGVTAYPLAALA
jgi:hypothetical protein